MDVMAGAQWTEAEVAYLREQYAAGLPLDEISKALQRSPTAIKTRAERLGLRRPPQLRASRMHDDIRREYMRAGPSSIAERWGVTANYVRTIARGLGFWKGHMVSPHINLRPKLAAELRFCSAREVAARHGMTKGQVMGQVHRYRRSMRNARTASEARG